MNRNAAFMIVCVPLFVAPAIAGEQITRSELLAAIADSIEILSIPGAPASPEAVAGVREVIVGYAGSAEPFPAVIDGLPAGARQGILQTKLTLFDTDPEYCRAEVRRFLAEVTVRAELSKRLPSISAAERREFMLRVDRLVSRAMASADRYLVAVLSRDEISQDLRRLSGGLSRMMEDPLCCAMKRVPSEAAIDALAAEVDAYLEKNRDRWSRVATATLPPAESARYLKARTGLRDVVLAEVIGVITERLAALTTPDWVSSLSMDDVAPGYSEARDASARLLQKQVAAAHARAHAAFLAKGRDARRQVSEGTRPPHIATIPAP